MPPQSAPHAAKEGISLAEYSHYLGIACHDPRSSNSTQIADGLLGIIKAEGPIQAKRAFDIYLRSCGIKRMGHDLRDSLLGAVLSLKDSKVLTSHKYTPQDDSLSEIIWVTGTQAEVIRKRGDRSLEEIPLGELFVITQLVASANKVSTGSEEHLRLILETLDLKRLTSNAEGILKRAISGDFTKMISA